MDPLHILRGANTAMIYLHNKLDVFHRSFVLPPADRHKMTNKTGADLKPPPVSLTSYLALGGLAVDFGFEGLIAANINLDLLGLGFRLLGQIDLQHALIIMGAHLGRIDRAG